MSEARWFGRVASLVKRDDRSRTPYTAPKSQEVGQIMRTIDAIARILKAEGIEYLSCFPTTPVIEAAVEAGIRPIICRQERVGVGIADGYSRVKNGRPAGVFAMQYGPGAENAFPGVATAYSDSTPLLLLPLGHTRDHDRIHPLFSSLRTYDSVTKNIEQMNTAGRVGDVMRRAFASLRNGRGGPVMVEIPADLTGATVDSSLADDYAPVPTVVSQADPEEVEKVAKVLLAADRPVIVAGAGVLYAEGSAELAELAEYLQIPVMTTMEGKSAISELHPLALGSGSGVMSDPVLEFLTDADVVLVIGSSMTPHSMVTPIPPGKIVIHSTNDPADIGKGGSPTHALLGDSRLVLSQLLDSVREFSKGEAKSADNGPSARIESIRAAWLADWSHKLESDTVPINPYRVIWELMRTIPPSEAIVTHDAGSPRFQIMPFYRSDGPRTYLGWGKSHQLGTGLGLAIGAKLAAPEKVCINFMGDAAFGMTGLDFETAVRSDLPIITVVLNNGTMAVETSAMELSHQKHRSRDLGGNYAEIGKSLGGWSERVTDPSQISSAFTRARRATEEGHAALLEFITGAETDYSNRRPFG
jgi:acetolactate synthase-1/2/3 large subunit